MSGRAQLGLLAIDIGTSRVKLGWFQSEVVCTSDKPFGMLPIAAPALPEPAETLAIQHRGVPVSVFAEQLAEALEPFDELSTSVAVASVDAEALRQVFGVLKNCQRLAVPQLLEVLGMPIKIAVQEPHRVGIDRLLAAVAVNRVRDERLPAIIVSMGTASTVNLISADGTFQGGAILPGLAMSAEALHQGTASLPMIMPDGWELPENAVGKNTRAAISAGVFWGTVGGIERLIAEQRRSLDAEPQIFLTGGDAALVADALKAGGHAVRVMPYLVLSGIAVACEALP